jgi:hypothetical protein
MNYLRIVVVLIALLAGAWVDAQPAAGERGFSPEVAGLRGRLHALEREKDGTCYARYTLYAGKDFRGRRGRYYSIAMRYFDASEKRVEPKVAGVYILMWGEHHFSDWNGEDLSMISFDPPTGAAYVSAAIRVDEADLVTEKVRIPVR